MHREPSPNDASQRPQCRDVGFKLLIGWLPHRQIEAVAALMAQVFEQLRQLQAQGFMTPAVLAQAAEQVFGQLADRSNTFAKALCFAQLCEARFWGKDAVHARLSLHSMFLHHLGA